MAVVEWPRHHRVVRPVIFGGSFFSFCFWLAASVLRNHLIPNVDSPRTIVPERTGMRMPGSFGDNDGDEEAVDKLILSIRELGVKDDDD